MAADGAPSRGVSAVLAAVLLLAACTNDPSSTARSPSPPASPVMPGEVDDALVVPVVATTSGPDAGADRTYLDGIELGAAAVNRRGGVEGRPLEIQVQDDGGDPGTTADLIRQAVRSPGTPAVLVVGPARSVVAARPEIEVTRTPVVLLGGDLYSGRDLFRQAFQTSIPYRWQAASIARYLVQDRGYERVVLVTERGPGMEVARQAFRGAMVEEGSMPSLSLPLSPATDLGGLVERMGDADAVAYFGDAPMGRRLSRALSALEAPPQLAASSVALQPSFAGPGDLEPGTVSPYPYTWAGWAEPIRRIGTFRDLCLRRLGHRTQGFEQEGFDAVRLLAAGLRRSGGHGGDALVRALESFTEALWSSLPIRLGPDDHLFFSDRQLGLFAVEGPGGDPEPWVADWAPWRPLMRTFTGNGERTTVIDRDKDVFFPGWRPREPAPDFWTARYGIVTRRGDPLH
jgi:ABC-type branched-subunit amino acid transport system substrate-binding protein